MKKVERRKRLMNRFMGNRIMDEERTRQAQLWWTFGVGVVLAVMALFQTSPRVEARTERTPAQLTLPYSGQRVVLDR